MAVDAERIRDFVSYLRDLGIYEMYRHGEAGTLSVAELLGESAVTAQVVQAAPLPAPETIRRVTERPAVAPLLTMRPAAGAGMIDPRVPLMTAEPILESSIPKPIPFDDLAPLPEVRVAAKDKVAALTLIRERIGDCTRCPLAYAGRHTIVFGNGDANARILFVGEGPGADEDASGLPFVGKAGQLLNNMIGAMGLTREQVYIANIVKCRPPGNRAPEPVEANTCSQFLLEQMDVVQPKVVVALGSTAATYLLGVKQSLSSLRGRWHGCRGAKLVVTYHPAFLLRDPRQKGEAWKDLQMVMAELGLKAAAKG